MDLRLLAVLSTFLLILGCASSPNQNGTLTPSAAQNITAEPPVSAHASNLSAQKLLWPIGCRLGVDCSISYYPDNDRWGTANCGPTYSAHRGTDIAISWESMDKGVDVYAAMNGRVQWVFDGKYDRCTNFNLPAGAKKNDNPDCNDPTLANGPGVSSGYMVSTESGDYCNATEKAQMKALGVANPSCYSYFYGGNVVVILHKNSSSVMSNSEIFATRYDHLKNGSILVKPGDYVVAGQKIAEVGSAGRSSGPHLHFEVWSDYYVSIDPWSPSCGFNGSFWKSIR